MDVPEYENGDDWWRHRQDVWKSAFGGKYFLKPLHGNEREWDDRVCIVVPGINPGVIVPGQDLIVQKSAFLAAVSSVDLSVFFQQRIGSGLFGGEGFIMQKLSGSGTAFLEFDGYIKEYELAPGQQIVVDTGYLAAMTGSCKIEVKTVPGVKNMLFGGEGIFNTVITGPGRVWLQSMPIAQMANTLRPYFPSNNH